MASLTPVYREIKHLRSTGDCAGAVALLRTAPPTSDEDAFEAVVCLFVCGDISSAAHVSETRVWQAQWACDCAGSLLESVRGSPARAMDLARRGASAPGASYDAAAMYLLLLKQNGFLEEADAYIESRLQHVAPDETFLQAIVAEVAAAVGKWREAYRAACAVLAADPDDYKALVVLSVANHQIGNMHEALGNALRASTLQPGAPPAILQLMRCRNKLGDHYGALAAFEKLADLGLANADFHVELGNACRGVEDASGAIAHYRAALSLDPESVPAIRSLVWLYSAAGQARDLAALHESLGSAVDRDFVCVYWLGIERLNRGDLDAAATMFKKAYALFVESGEALRKLPSRISESRMRHDYEQLELLRRRGRLDAAGQEALATLKRHCGEENSTERTFAPTGPDGDAVKDALCGAFCLPDPPFSSPTLGANDFAAIERTYMKDRIVVIDGFLSADALQALRRFCEEATVWKLSYDRGYVGAVLEEGFSPRVLLAIAYELKAALPHVIGEHPFTHAWAFKYDQRLRGINMHADFAEINVNFWITPDEACEDPTTGGMIVYDVPVPRSWTFHEYNNESDKLVAYAKVHKANARRVPYRANRCVLFDSSLIHITDELHFKPGYENRRVNVTILYGRPRNAVS